MRDNFGGITAQVNQLKESLVKESYICNIVSTHGKLHKRIASIFKAFRIARNYNLILGVGCAFRGFFPIFVAALVSKFRKRPVCYNFHDGQVKIFFDKNYSFIKNIFGKNPVAVASPFLHDEFLNRGFNPVLIPNHFDFNSFPVISKGIIKKNIIWARSFEPLYQPQVALKVAEKLVNNSDIEVHFYGDGSLYEDFKKKYEKPGIKLFGLINKIEFLNKYSDYKIFFNTTLYDNFPLSLVEAGFYGLLIVSTSSDGVKSLYTDDEVIFTDIRDEKDIYDKLLYAVDNYENLNQKIENVKNKIMSYSWDNVKDKWIQFFENSL